MPRLTQAVPKYRKHKASGQAIVTLNGKDYYLGPHGTKASKTEYDRLVGEWQANGRRMPTTNDTTVVELCAAFLAWAKTHYVKHGKPTDELASFRVVLRYLKEGYGKTPVAEFGPLALKGIRQQMIDAGNSRGYINKQISRIKLMFRWGVENEIVPVEVHQRLATVAGLAKGKTAARETDPILPVPDDVVDVTLPHLPAYTAAMVQVQRLAGMRPEDVCRMRPCDIDRSGDVWTYVPEQHKMEHKGRARIIFIGPKAQEILTPYLFGGDKPCFCPLSPYNTDSYRRAIHRAVTRANRQRKKVGLQPLPKWNPNQLRHSAGTLIRAKHGLEAAQIILGHASADVTQIYAERDLAKASEVMRQIG